MMICVLLLAEFAGYAALKVSSETCSGAPIFFNFQT